MLADPCRKHRARKKRERKPKPIPDGDLLAALEDLPSVSDGDADGSDAGGEGGGEGGSNAGSRGGTSAGSGHGNGGGAPSTPSDGGGGSPVPSHNGGGSDVASAASLFYSDSPDTVHSGSDGDSRGAEDIDSSEDDKEVNVCLFV